MNPHVVFLAPEGRNTNLPTATTVNLPGGAVGLPKNKKPRSFLIRAWKLVVDASYFNNIIFLMLVNVALLLDDVAISR
jgi:hypothetical protein